MRFHLNRACFCAARLSCSVARPLVLWPLSTSEVLIARMEIRDTRQTDGTGRQKRQWPRDVFVASALTLAALVLLGLTFVSDRGQHPKPVASSTEVVNK